MTSTLSPTDQAQSEQFADQLFQAALGAMELANIELGSRLGLYDALAHGSLTADELAVQAGISPRYAREWLEQQAVARVVTVDDVGAPEQERRFTLPPGHAHCLLVDDSELCVKPMAGAVPWLAKALELMTEEFRHGNGVDFGAFDLHDLQAAFSRPVFVHHLVQTWLPALPEVHQRLQSGEAVRIAEIGCGEGRAAILIAEAFPNAVIDAYDLDEASIAAARKLGADAGVLERVHFFQADASALEKHETYDLVMAIEMLHDVPDPIGVLTTMRRLAGDQGTVLVADENTKPTLTIDDDPMERLLYAFSTLHCLAVSMQGDGVGTGTIMRESTLRDYAASAGFGTVDVLSVEHPQFRLYRLS